jgi:solute:Na+ symporter, SSS family
MSLHLIDWVVMIVYFAFVLGVGVITRRQTKTSDDFFQAGRAIPAWVCGLAFLSANLGAQEVIGMAASGAKYGIATAHFYWIGAIPAMAFIGIFMMPFYYGSRARSVPEYLRLRFDEKTRAFNALSFAVMTVVSSGISMYAVARLIQTLHLFDGAFLALGLPPAGIFHVATLTSAVIVFIYIFLGGLTSAIYNEVLQFFLIVAGFVPLAWLGLRDIGGWQGLTERLPDAYVHAWAGMGSPESNLMGIEWFGLVMGLGFVLSFGYWCTDFLVVQLIAAVPKMLFPALVILPGLIAVALPSPPATPSTEGMTPAAVHNGAVAGAADGGSRQGIIPAKIDEATGLPRLDVHGRPELDYDLTIPMMLVHYFPPGMLGLGLIALIASFMAGMAGNVTAFNTVWTYDIYQSYVRPSASDAHYLLVGRLTTVVGIALSVATAYTATRFNNIMDLLQLVFAFVNAPLFATFLLGMFWKRTTGHGAFVGLLAGTFAAMMHHGLTLPAGAIVGIKGGWLGIMHSYASEMAQNFWTAIYAWTSCFIVTIVVSMLTRPRADQELVGLVYSLTPRQSDAGRVWYQRPVTLGAIVLAASVVLNIVFW